jgi:hypothetical protein
MGGTELKTDSSRRWVMYVKDTYGNGRIFLTAEQKRAVAEGKKFSQGAYADVWAKDTALVQRVRSFLGTNFYWHQRLAKSGADLEVIQALQSMIRGESVVLIAEQSRTGGVGIDRAPKPKGPPSFREELMTKLGMSYDAATAYMIRYNEIVEKIHAMEARCANRTASPPADAASDLTKTATPLGGAEPFEYGDDAAVPTGDSQLAWLPRTGGPSGAWVTNPSGSGQMRLYDGNGNAAVDFDFDHDHGFGAPHAHNWDGNIRDQGNAFSLLPY